MAKLDDLERRVLEDARDFLEPTSQDQVRVASLLGTSLSQPTPLRTVDSSRAARRWLSRLVASRGAVAVAAAAVGAAAGYSAGVAVDEKPTPVDKTTIVASATIDSPERRDPVPSFEANDDSTPVVAVPAPGKELAGAANPSAGTTRANRASALDEEVSLLSQAQQAIRSGNGPRAMLILGELDDRHPQGKLMQERQAAHVMARCLQLDEESARRAGRTYFRTSPNSVYRDRIRRLCAMDPEAPDGSVKESPSAGH